MSELDRINNTMKDGFNRIYDKVDEIHEKQICCEKDIEYIKKEINGKLDKRIKMAIDFSIIKEKYKGLAGVVGGIFGSIMGIITIIKFIVG